VLSHDSYGTKTFPAYPMTIGTSKRRTTRTTASIREKKLTIDIHVSYLLDKKEIILG
jgi:hypothetical protein